MIQAETIVTAVPHCTEENLLAEPTPIIAELITWVVETGNLINVAPVITRADVRSEAKPLGRIKFD